MKKIKLILMIVLVILVVYITVDYAQVYSYLNDRYPDEDLKVKFSPAVCFTDGWYTGYDENRENLTFRLNKNDDYDEAMEDSYFFELTRYKASEVLGSYDGFEVNGGSYGSDRIINNITIRCENPSYILKTDYNRMFEDLEKALDSVEKIDLFLESDNTVSSGRAFIYSHNIGDEIEYNDDIIESISPYATMPDKELNYGDILNDYTLARSNNVSIDDELYYVEININNGVYDIINDDDIPYIKGQGNLLLKNGDEIIFTRDISDDFGSELVYDYLFNIPLIMYDDENYYIIIGQRHDNVRKSIMYRVDVDNTKFEKVFDFDERYWSSTYFAFELQKKNDKYYMPRENLEKEINENFEVLFHDGNVTLGEIIED